MIGRNKDVTKLGKLKWLDMKLGNFISKYKKLIKCNLDNYSNIYSVIFVIFLLSFIVFKFDTFEHYLFQLSTLASAIVALYLGKGKNKIQICQNYEVRKDYAGVNIFGKNKSSCVIEITGMDITEINKNNNVVPYYYFEKIMNSEISATRLVSSDGITRIAIIDTKNKIDILNPVLNERQKISTVKENNEFIKWIKNPDGIHEYEINIYYKRNDKYRKNSVRIPMKSIIDQKLINLKK